MEKFMKIVCCALAALACAGLHGDGMGGDSGREKPCLRIAVMSDNQFRPDAHNWAWHVFGRALAMIGPMKVDLVLNAGDISDYDDIPTVRRYERLCREALGAELFAVPGNHDIWLRKGSGRTYDQVIGEFYGVFGQPASGHVSRRTINGYDFVAVATREKLDGEEVAPYYEAEADELEKVLAQCVRRAPGKPVFVLSHYHPEGTVLGSSARYGRRLRKVLDKYPQVISLSGHTHCPLANERMIWQGTFTAINTSTLHYGCYPGNKVNTVNGILPLARESVGFMVMDVFSDRVEVRRYNADDGKELTPPSKRWVISVPYNPSKPAYGENRRAALPQFAPGAEMLSRYDYGFIHFLFDPAEGADGVAGYRLAVSGKNADGTWGRPESWRYVSDFYRLERHRGGRVNLRAPAFSLEPGKNYRLQVYPYNWFGGEGRPLALEMEIAPWYRFRNIDETYPQE